MKKINNITCVIICIVMMLSLSGCSSTVKGVTGEKRTINVATVNQKEHPETLAMYALRDYLKKNFGDKFEMNIYTGGLMGGNSQALELLQMGTLDMVVTSGSQLETFNKKYKIFGLPYLFNDEASFRKVMKDEEFINEIYDCTADKGIQGLAWFANGVNNFYASKRIETPEDLKGLKIRVQSSEANVKMAQGFGAAAVIMTPSEVYTALQSHVIDAATNPEIAFVTMKNSEVSKFYSRTEHQIFTDMLVASTKFMDSLTDEEKEIFKEGFKICTQVENEEWDKQTVSYIEEAKNNGVEFITVDKKLFEELQKPVSEKLLKANPELQQLYEKVKSIQN